ncbi:hypothetical protein LA345_40240 (plasmid) [Burkholderia vietnamiensis]|nr:hypothetical protein [Burkholderia vietnamiensis]
MIQAYQILSRIEAGETVEIPAIRLEEFFAQAARLPGPIALGIVIDQGLATLQRGSSIAAR